MHTLDTHVQARIAGRRHLLDGCRIGLRYAAQLALLYLLLVAGSAVSEILPLPLPGSLVGLLLLLALLGLGVIRLRDVEDTASILVQHLNLFFIPLVVGMVAWGGLIATRGVALAVCLVGSVVVGLIAAGVAGQRLSSQGEGDGAG
jgi:holin-like protein